MRKALQAGFTLIELVAVIVILGILAAIAVPQFIDVAGSARTAVAQSACGAMQSQAVLYFASNRTATSLATMVTAVNNASSGVSVSATDCSNITAHVPNVSPVLDLACNITIPGTICTTP